MAQAKGVLPNKADDREILYKSPQTCGYFIGLTLGQPSEPDLRGWLSVVDDEAVDVGELEEPPYRVHHRDDREVHQSRVAEMANVELHMGALDHLKRVKAVALAPGKPASQLGGIQHLLRSVGERNVLRLLSAQD